MYIKICGITSLKDALIAVEAGADYLGFNFYPPSPRFITQETCAEITAVLARKFPLIKRVGVFVNMPVEQIKSVLDDCALDLAQLHGDETPLMLDALTGQAFKVFRGVPKSGIELYARQTVPAFMIDAAVRGQYGGTGVQADWSAAAEYSRRYPLLLAGGLKPENVAEAVRAVRPWGVDAASGVESDPGKKDPQRIKAFVEAAREAEAKLRAGEKVSVFGEGGLTTEDGG